MRLLGPSDYKVMPWKNGGGATTELLIHPAGASLDAGFTWRLSMADVASSGPFSSFPGIDRTLLLLAGNGMELDHGEHGIQLLEGPLRPVTFSGDWATRGRLLDGPCRDFNVMSARGGARQHVTVLHLGEELVPLPEAPVRAVFCAQGRAQVGETLLGEKELGILEPGEGAASRSVSGRAVLVVVRFTPLQA